MILLKDPFIINLRIQEAITTIPVIQSNVVLRGEEKEPTEIFCPQGIRAKITHVEIGLIIPEGMEISSRSYLESLNLSHYENANRPPRIPTWIADDKVALDGRSLRTILYHATNQQWAYVESILVAIWNALLIQSASE